MDAWRQAFANFGGSVRRIFQQMDAHIEDDIDANVMSITTDQLRLLTANADIFFDAASLPRTGSWLAVGLDGGGCLLMFGS